jgi:hypothetical protein
MFSFLRSSAANCMRICTGNQLTICCKSDGYMIICTIRISSVYTQNILCTNCRAISAGNIYYCGLCLFPFRPLSVYATFRFDQKLIMYISFLPLSFLPLSCLTKTYYASFLSASFLSAPFRFGPFPFWPLSGLIENADYAGSPLIDPYCACARATKAPSGQQEHRS